MFVALDRPRPQDPRSLGPGSFFLPKGRTVLTTEGVRDRQRPMTQGVSEELMFRRTATKAHNTSVRSGQFKGPGMRIYTFTLASARDQGMIWMINPSRDMCRGSRAIWAEGFTFGPSGEQQYCGSASSHRHYLREAERAEECTFSLWQIRTQCGVAKRMRFIRIELASGASRVARK